MTLSYTHCEFLFSAMRGDDDWIAMSQIAGTISIAYKYNRNMFVWKIYVVILSCVVPFQWNCYCYISIFTIKDAFTNELLPRIIVISYPLLSQILRFNIARGIIKFLFAFIYFCNLSEEPLSCLLLLYLQNSVYDT